MAVACPVDAIDGPLQADPAAVGQFDRGGVVGAEPQLGGEHRRPASNHDVAVVVQPGEQIVEHPGAFVGPERRATGAPTAFGAFAHLIEEPGEGVAVLVGPSVGAGLGERAVDHRLVEEIERRVVGRAAVAGGDADLVARLLDRLDVEQVPVEVGVRAGRPGFEAAR